MKKIKCAYCMMEEHDHHRWFTKDDLAKHIFTQHPDHDFRTIDDVLASWRMIGLYEEKEIEVK